MIPLLTREESRAHDQRLIMNGVPGVILMENAGRGATDAILARYGERLSRDPRAPIVVVGGTGQNGGDAWVVARRLRTLGHHPLVFLAGEGAAVGGDAAINLRALSAVGVEVRSLDGLELALSRASLVVEGLFGTGLDRPIAGWRADLVRTLDQAAARAPLVSLDLPSGIDADTGAVLGVALHASLTVTFAGHKRGLWQHPGRAFAGDVEVADIGATDLDGADLDGAAAHGHLLELADAARLLPEREDDAHKGTAGHVLVVAGSPGKTGAALLCGVGAMRAGAGRVTLAAEEPARAALDGKVVELMTATLELDLSAVRELASGKAAVVMGPGLGLGPAQRALMVEVAMRLERPLVLDADALTALAREGPEVLRGCAWPRVLTPHPQEAARLLRGDTSEVQADRYAAAASLAQRSGQVVVLKGAGTIIADPSGRLAVCPLGTPALGVAGTGDVLAGAIGAALASVDGSPSAPAPNHERLGAVCAAVVLHARAGERASKTDRGLFALEVAAELPAALAEARSMTS